VPAGTARLRFAFTAQHPDDEIERLADIVRDCILRSRPRAHVEPAHGHQG
jgi:8-amino-7-oxononanoate synthase